MKALLFALAIFPLVASDYGWISSIYNWQGQRNISHNLVLGAKGYGDRLLYHNFINVHRQLFQKINRSISYPSHGTSPFHITCISVIDLKKDGTGGYPSLQHGGIYYYNAMIHLESQRSHGLHFNITIYGR